MPTYQYECKTCGYEFELFQPMKERPKRKCPKCSRMSLRRLIGAGAGVIFKGSGFYQTDYRSNDYKKQAKAEQPASGAKESSNGQAKSGKKGGSGESAGSKKGSGKTSCGPGCACASE